MHPLAFDLLSLLGAPTRLSFSRAQLRREQHEVPLTPSARNPSASKTSTRAASRTRHPSLLSAFSATHSGSAVNFAQLSVAASRLLCRSIYTIVRPASGSSVGTQYPTPCIPQRAKISVSLLRNRVQDQRLLSLVQVVDPQLIHRLVGHCILGQRLVPSRHRNHRRRSHRLHQIPSIHRSQSPPCALAPLYSYSTL